MTDPRSTIAKMLLCTAQSCSTAHQKGPCFSCCPPCGIVIEWLINQCVGAPQDFLEMLPMPEYSHPKGPLNLVSYLRDNSVKPDLGPKSYVAFGRCAQSPLLPARAPGSPSCLSTHNLH